MKRWKYGNNILACTLALAFAVGAAVVTAGAEKEPERAGNVPAAATRMAAEPERINNAQSVNAQVDDARVEDRSNWPSGWDGRLDNIGASKFGGDSHFFSSTRGTNGWQSDANAGDAVLINTRQWNTQEVTSIRADFLLERVTLLTSPTDEIILKEYHSYNDEAYRAPAVMSNGTLQLLGSTPPTDIWFSAYAELYLPSGYAGTVTLNSRGGELEVLSCQASGLNLCAVGADITAKNSKISGSLISNANNVTITGCTGALHVQADAGNITASGPALSGSFASMAGNVEIATDSLAGNITATTTAGGAWVTLPGDASFRLEAKTNGGPLVNDYAGTWTPAPGSVSGACGSNPVYTVTARSYAGPVSILKAEPPK